MSRLSSKFYKCILLDFSASASTADCMVYMDESNSICLRVQWNKTLLLVFLRNRFNVDNVCDIRNCTRSLACHEEINAESLFHSLEVWQELPVYLMS